VTIPWDASVVLASSAIMSSDGLALETSKIAIMLKLHSDIKRYAVNGLPLTHVAVINTGLAILS